jgi:uncharacterized protein (DUF433 family)
MEATFWTDCPMIHSDPEIVHGEPVFVGTRLPAAAIVDSMDGYLEDGLSLDQAIAETLESFPTVPNGPAGIRALLDYCATHARQFQL